jgi:pyridoxamine 5'-phosphate oxidase
MEKLRREYGRTGLDEARAAGHPLRQFERWFHDAVEAGLREPNAMTLATAASTGRPSARIVLLKDFNRAGFLFFTNYESRKGRELAENPRAALVFHWNEIERQVRIEGRVRRIPRAASLKYFRSRPRDTQLAAWASKQSGPLPDRQALDTRHRMLVKKFEGKEVPLPAFWGGYMLEPDRFEFWQGRENRMHDRLVYIRRGAKWSLGRLAP